MKSGGRDLFSIKGVCPLDRRSWVRAAFVAGRQVARGSPRFSFFKPFSTLLP